MNWIQLIIETQQTESSALEDALLEAGAVSITLADNADQPILEPALGTTPLWDETRVTALFSADVDTEECETIASLHYGKPLPPHRWEALEERDWSREWMKHFKPIHCDGDLWICPSWCEPPDANATNLLLDPGLAFGTGTHPTTFLCLQWLATQPLQDKTIIDFGCGSGILGIAALLLGAKQACGIDIDPQALVASQDNTRRNNLPASAFNVYFPDAAPTEAADILLANILAGPLAELAPILTDRVRPGGLLCLSGILEHQAQYVMSAYSEHFAFDPIAQKDDWVRLTAKRLSHSATP